MAVGVDIMKTARWTTDRTGSGARQKKSVAMLAKERCHNQWGRRTTGGIEGERMYSSQGLCRPVGGI